MRRKSLLLVIFAALTIAAPALADWCSGAGPGWFMVCSNTQCTFSQQQKDGSWRYWVVPRSQGELLCTE